MKKHKLRPLTITAHTGCVSTKENSLQAIERGVECGAHIVEFDVQYHNSEPVLSHDKPKGDEITLEQAFLKVKEYNSLKVNVDIKSVEHLHTVGEIADKTGVKDRIFFTGINEAFVSAVQNECPDIKYYLNVNVLPKREQTDEYLKTLVEKVRASGAVGINFDKKGATKRLVEVFHNNGLQVSVWTVNGYFNIRKIISYNPDNITSKRPDRVKKILNKK